MRIRFHLDEHVHPAIAVGLRRRGVEVTTTPDAELLGADDETQLAYCHAEGRVLVTQDEDFLALHGQGLAHAGIAYCHQKSRSIGDLIRSLLLIYDGLSAEEIRGEVEFL